MKRAQEELFAVLFALAFPVVLGFVVAASIYVDGFGAKSLFLLVIWLAASSLLWGMPSILQRLGGKKEVLRDERDALILAKSALIAHAVTWLYFISACVVACWNMGANAVISANVLPLVLVGGAVIFQVGLVLASFVLEKTGCLSWPLKS